MNEFCGIIRQVLNEDLLILTLEGITYFAKKSEVEETLKHNHKTKMGRKYNGKIISDGLIFLGKTGKTLYTYTGDKKRYRSPCYQISLVIEEPGTLAIASYCPSINEVT